ncbi:GNAT family N-acetyltransferase [Promicromonospora thailandica]|uniref:Acetyltransferase (GNAT) domain-containing protein n=1 Tax=Promicromonospora thailandica TaxID=765201 RepID=A0A9X2G1Y4_9MICO|nr:GNAT family N-acetyltransferase [Promicromonospora thailandica]MCP2264173.1 Acetyltransferase (GNAT) domain-containing protein [Promicromonospora thailandica]
MNIPANAPADSATTHLSDQDLTALAETVEAEAMYAYVAQAPAATVEGLGTTTTRLGGGVVLSARLDPYDYWSKAVGLGVTEPVTHDLVGEVIDFYRAQRTPTALFQIAPSLLPEDWDEIRAAHGLEPAGTWNKHAAPIDGLRTDAMTDLRVARVQEDDAAEWATVVATTFGMDNPALVAMLTESVHTPGCQLFAAWDGDTIVAGGALFLHGTTASLHSGATAPSHRGRGAQSALVAARIEAARAAGARWVVSETGKAAPGERNPSTENMRRAGVRVAYARPNWRWRA